MRMRMIIMGTTVHMLKAIVGISGHLNPARALAAELVNSVPCCLRRAKGSSRLAAFNPNTSVAPWASMSGILMNW
jgi:hypothetical protein